MDYIIHGYLFFRGVTKDVRTNAVTNQHNVNACRIFPSCRWAIIGSEHNNFMPKNFLLMQRGAGFFQNDLLTHPSIDRKYVLQCCEGNQNGQNHVFKILRIL
jgi:hypothetical protein